MKAYKKLFIGMLLAHSVLALAEDGRDTDGENLNFNKAPQPKFEIYMNGEVLDLKKANLGLYNAYVDGGQDFESFRSYFINGTKSSLSASCHTLTELGENSILDLRNGGGLHGLAITKRGLEKFRAEKTETPVVEEYEEKVGRKVKKKTRSVLREYYTCKRVGLAPFAEILQGLRNAARAYRQVSERGYSQVQLINAIPFEQLTMEQVIESLSVLGNLYKQYNFLIDSSQVSNSLHPSILFQRNNDSVTEQRARMVKAFDKLLQRMVQLNVISENDLSTYRHDLKLGNELGIESERIAAIQVLRYLGFVQLPMTTFEYAREMVAITDSYVSISPEYKAADSELLKIKKSNFCTADRVNIVGKNMGILISHLSLLIEAKSVLINKDIGLFFKFSNEWSPHLTGLDVTRYANKVCYL